LGGLALGWLVYRNYKTGQVDPLKKALGGIHTVLENKYYIDELYHAVFIKPALWLAETFSYRWIDLGVIDGILNGIGKAAWGLGEFLRRFIDLPLITGAGDGLAGGTHKVGGFMRRVQSGQVQQYLLFSLFTILLVGVVFFYFIVLA
jgi:NADH-quinone oxidoreductase subunit L